MNTTQSFISSGSFEEAPRPAYDGHQNGMFRPDDLSHGVVGQAPGYSYMTNDGRGMMVDSSQRPPMH